MLLSRAIRSSPGRCCFLRGGTRRHASEVAEARRGLLEDIYRPFKEHAQDSPEWDELARSGRVWEGHFRPGDVVRMGYVRAQEDNAAALRDIEVLKASMKTPIHEIAKEYAPACAYQSVQMDDSRLTPDEAVVVSGRVNSSLDAVDVAALDPKDLRYSIPEVAADEPLLADADPVDVVAFRNHLVASRRIAEASWRRRATPGFDEADVSVLAALAMRDLGRNGYYAGVLGPRVRLGGYRQVPISVRGDPLRIFPYHLEVPACMRRFFLWRRAVHEDGSLHPLVVACHTVAYFLHIHPFPDANGRVSRMMMQDYLLRQGYCPTVLHPLDRDDYVRMVSDAQDGRPDEFVARVVTNQLETLKTNKMREAMDLRGVEEMDGARLAS